jgi:hypothetical protein
VPELRAVREAIEKAAGDPDDPGGEHNYTLKGAAPTEVVLDPASAAVRKAEKITESDDLKDAAGQTAAMAKASRTLLAATADAVKANPGSRAISAMPRLDGGHPVADVILLQGGAFNTVAEKLD